MFRRPARVASLCVTDKSPLWDKAQLQAFLSNWMNVEKYYWRSVFLGLGTHCNLGGRWSSLRVEFASSDARRKGVHSAPADAT